VFSDEEFDRHLDEFVEATVRVVDKGCRMYASTVLLAYEDELRFEVLVPEEEPDERPADLYEVLRQFGVVLGRQRKTPAGVFVAVLTVWGEGSSCIFIAGSTPDGRKNGTKLGVTQDNDACIRIHDTTTFHCRDNVVYEGRTYSCELMRGMLEGATHRKTPWWKFW
jgi:hypothetical protein